MRITINVNERDPLAKFNRKSCKVVRIVDRGVVIKIAGIEYHLKYTDIRIPGYRKRLLWESAIIKTYYADSALYNLLLCYKAIYEHPPPDYIPEIKAPAIVGARRGIDRITNV